MKKITKKQIKIFLHGFDYGVKNYQNDKDALFHMWNAVEEDNKIYRKAVKLGKQYAFYRAEVLAISLCLMGLIILLTF
jgi:hypothetical protein